MHLKKDHPQITSIKDASKQILSLSAHKIQGRRDHMEDNFDIAYQLKPADSQQETSWPYEYFYLGIFDGHGGSNASIFAKKNLVKYITKQDHFWSDNDEDVMRAIRDGFRETQHAMKQESSFWNYANSYLPSTAGTTASILFIKNGKFYSGHVGDSRILVVRENEETKNWLPCQITEDHKPENPSEIDRIERAGGEVRDKLGVQRVVWNRPVLVAPPKSCPIEEFQEFMDKLPREYPVDDSYVSYYQRVPFLAIARSLGDFWSIHPFTGLYIVSPEPDVSCRPITPQDKAIMLASDGLWNVLSSCQASRMLQELNTLKSVDKDNIENEYFSVDNYYDVAGDDCKNHAKSLVYFAYQTWERRRLRSDNITVVVAMLNDLLSQQSLGGSLTNPRLINKVEKHNYDWADFGVKQLGETKTYFENIFMDRSPKFAVAEEPICSEYELGRIENLLVLPPSLVQKNHPAQFDSIVAPRNYQKLTAASYRRIGITYLHDAYIYIKHVSDDPEDELERPSRINKHGKEVRDSSAQATQCLHDFGQPWFQMVECSKGESDENILKINDLVDEDEDENEDEDEDKLDTREFDKYLENLFDEELFPMYTDESYPLSPRDDEELQTNISRCDNSACPLKNRKSHDMKHQSRSDKHHLRCLMNSPRQKYSNYQIETRGGGVKRRFGCDCLEYNRSMNLKTRNTNEASLQCDIPLC